MSSSEAYSSNLKAKFLPAICTCVLLGILGGEDADPRRDHNPLRCELFAVRQHNLETTRSYLNATYMPLLQIRHSVTLVPAAIITKRSSGIGFDM